MTLHGAVIFPCMNSINAIRPPAVFNLKVFQRTRLLASGPRHCMPGPTGKVYRRGINQEPSPMMGGPGKSSILPGRVSAEGATYAVRKRLETSVANDTASASQKDAPRVAFCLIASSSFRMHKAHLGRHGGLQLHFTKGSIHNTRRAENALQLRPLGRLFEAPGARFSVGQALKLAFVCIEG
ncbi:hypothetical protein Dalk_2083 [Desulfatibacillum aliphaticivorans]|uniref:Uncharacterized protein n=1 Tax=Desulfatibacillum aliphaticivorans TaxID=218208 RepID=B8FG97_DESAL|nr:hypothetical protein Dalk_2083 [Desulfatibacillum aliphaticivorans]